MRRTEFNEVMVLENIEKTDKKRIGIGTISYTTESIYSLDNMEISFSGTDAAIVRGRIPLELANTTYKKYKKDSGKEKPIDSAIDDEYKDEMIEYLRQNLNKDEYNKKWLYAIGKLRARSNENKYITYYKIDTKEELEYFINVYQKDDKVVKIKK